MKALLAAVAGALVLLTGCGGDDDAAKTSGMRADTAPATKTLRISDFQYQPDPSVVKAGTKLTISNADDAPHTVTDKGSPRAFDSGTIEGGKRSTVTLSEPGTYAFFCEFHPTMAGKVTVER